MTLSEYVALRPRGLSALARAASVGRVTIYRAMHGQISRKAVAERIALATDGEVSVLEVLGIALPPPKKKSRRPCRSATRAGKT